MKTSMFPARALSVVAAAALLSACATMGGKPEDVVAQRAQAYWDARTSGDMAKAYALTTPAYRKIRSQLDFTRENRATGAERTRVQQVECAPERCTVNMEFQAAVALPMQRNRQKPVTITTSATSVWLLENGEWWLYMEP